MINKLTILLISLLNFYLENSYYVFFNINKITIMSTSEIGVFPKEGENNVNVRASKGTNKKALDFNRAIGRVPNHTLSVSSILMMNADMRRHTSHGILNYLTQKGFIPVEENGVKVKKYVDFQPGKFAVIVNGLRTEYLYKEPFFLNALVAAFTTFSANSQRFIDNFLSIECKSSINDTVDVEEVQRIAKSVESSINVEVEE